MIEQLKLMAKEFDKVLLSINYWGKQEVFLLVDKNTVKFFLDQDWKIVK